MTTIKHGGSWISFHYRSNLDGVDLSKFYNVIEVVNASDDVSETMGLCDGEFVIGPVQFPNMFQTIGFEHTFSVCGQWHWLIDKFVRELADATSVS